MADDKGAALAAAVAPAAAPQPAAAPRTDAIVDRWFRERIHNSPAARSTEAFNHFSNELAELKRRLAGER